MENASQYESEGVLCEGQAEVEDTVEHWGYNTANHPEDGSTSLTLSVLKEWRKRYERGRGEAYEYNGSHILTSRGW